MKIVFLADMHFKEDSHTGGLKIQYASSVAADPLIPMLERLNERYSSDKISLLIFMGDYATGSASEDDKRTRRMVA